MLKVSKLLQSAARNRPKAVKIDEKQLRNRCQGFIDAIRKKKSDEP